MSKELKRNLRQLTEPELRVAERVYRDSLPWRRIWLSPAIALNSRAYVIGRRVNVGPEAYQQGMHKGGKASVLIHELCHVWQYEHRGWSGSYICDSVYADWFDSKAASNPYSKDSKIDRPWDEYGAEQQAQIVKFWYNTDCDPTDELFHYIRDNIRQKHIDANDDPWDRVPSGI